MKTTKTLPVVLSVILLFCACSSKRNPGIIITTIGAVAVAGVGLLVAALGVYLLVTLRDDYEDEEVAQWPEDVPEIPEIRGQDRL
jgi:hypothetical protein